MIDTLLRRMCFLCFCTAVCLLVRPSLWKSILWVFLPLLSHTHTPSAHTHVQGVGHKSKHRSEKSLVTRRLSTCIYGLVPGTSEGFLSGSTGLRRGHALHLVMMMLEKSKPRRVTRWWDFSCRKINKAWPWISHSVPWVCFCLGATPHRRRRWFKMNHQTETTYAQTRAYTKLHSQRQLHRSAIKHPPLSSARFKYQVNSPACLPSFNSLFVPRVYSEDFRS